MTDHLHNVEDRSASRAAWVHLAELLDVTHAHHYSQPDLELAVAAEIRRRGWRLGNQNSRHAPEHGTRACWEKGCRRFECVRAASIAKGYKRRGVLPSLRLPAGRRP